MTDADDAPWWKRLAMYEVYVPSFADSDGDGWGDLDGVTSKLDYLQELGVGILWLTPFYPTPFVDCGYDISDFRDVDPRYGTLAAFDRLLAEARSRDLRLLVDFVPNHTSDRHPWFQRSRSSRDDPYREWYCWSDPRPNGDPPNNWIDRLGESAWEWDETTEQFYLHSFAVEQPDLNWRNRDVRDAMYDVLRFWLARGVDGFRVDAPAYLMKDRLSRDDPPDPAYTPDKEPNTRQAPVFSQNQNETFEILREMRTVVDEFDGDRLLYAEGYLEIPRMTSWLQAGVHLSTNAFLARSDFDATALRHQVGTVEGALGQFWPNWATGNHDLHRLATRLGGRGSRLAALIQLTLRGTPTIYYGEEIGMRDGRVPPRRMHDPSGKKRPRFSRDLYRTPMQWSDERRAGFSTAEPWLPVASGYRRVNVKKQRDDPSSHLTLYRRLLALRNREPALQVGDYLPLSTSRETVWAYVRRRGRSRFLIVANFDARRRQQVDLSDSLAVPAGEVILSTHARAAGEPFEGSLGLAPREGVVIHLTDV